MQDFYREKYTDTIEKRLNDIEKKIDSLNTKVTWIYAWSTGAGAVAALVMRVILR